MRILFLDQSGKLGGAELSLADVASFYREQSLVGLFADGPFRALLEHQQIPVHIFATPTIAVQKDSHFLQSLSRSWALIPLIAQVAQKAQHYDLIYANTQKALVVGAFVSLLSRRPLVYHLRDILSDSHFSRTNQRIAVMLANRFAAHVITNSKATQAAFINAGGTLDRTTIIYNGFHPGIYERAAEQRAQVRHALGLSDRFIVGHFSRLSPWKGQHILLESLAHCPDNVVAILVGDALFGEQDYVAQLHQQVETLGLATRVKFLGFRSDVPALMTACDLVAHTSIAPEPFGRVIVEAMLCGTPVVAAEAGGAVELVTSGKTGWLFPPGDCSRLSTIVEQCRQQPELAQTIAYQAKYQARQRFDLSVTNQQIADLLTSLVPTTD